MHRKNSPGHLLTALLTSISRPIERRPSRPAAGHRLRLSFAVLAVVPREAMVDGVPLPATVALIDWFERSTKVHSFIEGAAATNLAAEGQVPGAFGPFARALERHYGCTREDVAFWDIHEQADREHSAIGDHIVVRLATTPELRTKVREAVACSLAHWWRFFDGIAGAVGAG